MEVMDPKLEKCMGKAVEYVRQELKASEFEITNDKIRAYCLEHDNSIKKVRSGLKKHAEKMREMNLAHIQTLPLEAAEKCKLFLT
jgi:hypothetical protein